MIGQMRERCGLGSPPQEYNQNANECENSVTKKHNESKLLTIKEAIQSIVTETERQEKNIKFSIIRKGQ